MGGRQSSGVGAIALCAALACLVPLTGRAQADPAGETATLRVPRGELVRIRPGAPQPAAAAPLISDGGASDDLPEVEGFTAAGGTTVSLGGRFRTSVTMRRDGHAPVEECLTDPAVSSPAD